MMRRGPFLGGTAAALGAGSLGAPAASAQGTTSHLADLRFGYAPTAPPRPGFDAAADAKALIVPGTPSPAGTPVPGRVIVGGRGEARWLVRVPDAWNGDLVVLGTPAFRSEYANDAIWGDYLLARGYAFATSNKGIPYNAIVEPLATSPAPDRIYPIPFDLGQLESKKLGYRLGALAPAKVGIAAWNDDYAALTVFAKDVVRGAGRPAHTYAVGLSNGGAQVRTLLERHPELVDGGVEWAGVFWSPQHSLLDYLPPFLRAMPAYVASAFTDQSAAGVIASAGFPADRRQAEPHPSLWFEYYAGLPSFYADLTLFAYALLIDPEATSLPGADGCIPSEQNAARLPGTCRGGEGLQSPSRRAAYAPSQRARDAIRAFAHSGAIGKPLISVAGDADVFITPQNNAQPYLEAVKASGKSALYRQYIVQGGTHVDTFAPLGYGLQPQLPFAWAAFEQLVAIVERGATPAGAGSARSVATPAEIGSA